MVAADVLFIQPFTQFVDAVISAIDEDQARSVVLVVDVHLSFHQIHAKAVAEVGGVVVVAPVA